MAKRPSFQFYPGDWLRDTALRSCSLAARGLWAEMLWLMHDGTPYGTLKVGSKVILPPNLARMVGATLEEVEGWLEELREAEVYSVDDEGAIYSRRMKRDEEVRQKRAAGGILGGNPALMVNHEATDKVNLPPTPASASASASAKKKKDKAPSEPPASRPPNEQALRVQRMEERFRAGGVTPPKPAIIALWLKTLGSEERMLAFLDDMAHRGKLGVMEYCGRVVTDWEPKGAGRRTPTGVGSGKGSTALLYKGGYDHLPEEKP